jgi:hypothetical protein
MILALVENGRSQGTWPLVQTAKTKGAEAIDWTANGYATVKQEVTQTVNQLADLTTQATGAASTALHDSSAFVVNTVTNSSMTHAAQGAIHGAVETVTNKTNQLIERSRSGLTELTNTVQTAKPNFMAGWLDQHPILHWMVDHPLGAILLLVLGMFLLTGLFKAIAYIAEQLWIAVLRFPMQLGRWGWRLVSGGFKPALAQPTFPKGEKEQHRERLTYVLHRLEAIKQEQDRLLQELQELLE